MNWQVITAWLLQYKFGKTSTPKQLRKHAPLKNRFPTIRCGVFVFVNFARVARPTSKDSDSNLILLVVYGNEERRLLTPETKQRGKSIVESTDDFGHEVAKISVIGRAKKTDL